MNPSNSTGMRSLGDVSQSRICPPFAGVVLIFQGLFDFIPYSGTTVKGFHRFSGALVARGRLTLLRWWFGVMWQVC